MIIRIPTNVFGVRYSKYMKDAEQKVPIGLPMTENSKVLC